MAKRTPRGKIYIKDGRTRRFSDRAIELMGPDTNGWQLQAARPADLDRDVEEVKAPKTKKKSDQ